MNALTAAEEASLISRAKEGDSTASTALLEAYSGLVSNFVRRFGDLPGLTRGDVEQAATIGLLYAIQAHDLEKSGRLVSWAYSRMMYEVKQELSLRNAVHVSPKALNRYAQVLRQADGDFDRAKELAPSVGMASKTFAALHITLHSADIADASEIPAPDEPFVAVEDRILVSAALKAMTAEQREVVTLRYGLGAYSETTLLGVGEELNLTRSVVYRRHAEALQAARSALGVI